MVLVTMCTGTVVYTGAGVHAAAVVFAGIVVYTGALHADACPQQISAYMRILAALSYSQAFPDGAGVAAASVAASLQHQSQTHHCSQQR